MPVVGVVVVLEIGDAVLSVEQGEPVGLGNSVVPVQAAFRYSLMRRSQRVDLSTVMLVGDADGGSPTASGGR